MMIGWKMAGALVALMGPHAACIADDDRSIRVQQPASPFTPLYPSAVVGRLPAILVLGGAEGGDSWAKSIAEKLAQDGYAALAAAYFNSPGLDPQLQEIPLERLRQGIDRLAADPRVDPRRIAVLGLSKGAEAALLLASTDRRIKAVIAASPSDVVWQGIDRKTGSIKSSWTFEGKPLPFVPFAACGDCRSLGDLYVKSRTVAGVLAPAAIPTERIQGPILLLSSESDAVWPSQTMAEGLERRLKRHRFRYRVSLLRYPDGGHFTLGPIDPRSAASDADFGGGTADGVLAARQDSWRHVISFLDRSFRTRASAR